MIQPLNFFIFGDSISFGQFVSPHRTWVTKVADVIEKKLAPAKVRIINTSISGNTTRMALERMPYDVQSHGCDYMMVEFGMNDCNCWDDHKGLARVSEKAFEANLLEILERGKVFGAKKIFILTNHPTTKKENFNGLNFSYQQQNENYNNIIRKVAEMSKCILIDIESGFKADAKVMNNLQDYLLPDRIHLSEWGHDLYGAIVEKKLLSEL